MPTRRITATINSKEVVMQVAVPDRQGTESTPNYEARVSSFLSEYI